jgi:hypothetical protein
VERTDTKMKKPVHPASTEKPPSTTVPFVRPTWPDDKFSQLMKKTFFSGRPLPIVIEPNDGGE